MTDKKAIEILKLECDDWETSHCTPQERREAFRAAITALEARRRGMIVVGVEPGDLISRKGAFSNAQEWAWYKENVWLQPKFDKWLRRLPPVEMKPGEDWENSVQKAESTQDAQDLISRKAAVDAIDELKEHIDKNGDACFYMRDIYDVIDGLPPAQQKTPRQDAISREAVLKAAAEACACTITDRNGAVMDKTYTALTYGGIVKLLKEAPPVMPEPYECEDAVSRMDVYKVVEKDIYNPDPFGLVESLRRLPPVKPQLAKCEDAVSRQSVIEKINALQIRGRGLPQYSVGYNSGLISAIEAVFFLPRVSYDKAVIDYAYSSGYKMAEAKRKRSEVYDWIPVTERLPESTDVVLAAYTINGNQKMRYAEMATYHDGGEGCWLSHWDKHRAPETRKEVVAWMPLPDPNMLTRDEFNE